MAIGIVVVGLGPRGQDWLREVQTNPAYELAACVDIDRPTLNQAAGKLSLPPGKCFTELGEALGEEPDSSGRDNLQTMAVVEACLRSAAERTLG